MDKLKISVLVQNRLKKLIDILLDNEYFAFEESAIEYVNKIETFILNISIQSHRICKNNKYGKYYAKYKPNKRTAWYIIFDKLQDLYLVKFITNNHTKDYPRFIKGIIF